jgi:hypothetical protein
METGQGKYLIVTNLMADPVFIAPDSRVGDNGRVREDLILTGYASITARPLDWADDAVLERCAERGLVSVTWSDKRAKPLPARPASAETGHPALNNMIYEMVFGKDENARGFIGAEKRILDRAGQPVDREWTKGTLWKCLEGARDWLQLWGPPESFSWRLDLIAARLEEIRRMP